ncbi:MULTISPECIES: hypothetical protein [unclassified Bradyrhizobium]|uniref:hypothetical protein n=1 Tax=unclassified Bradyrhizobium TaxID=2631580 RepID=UPI0028E61FFF|nr:MULTISPECIES: hypothetical protein [unclassified Bradyrhizobium]
MLDFSKPMQTREGRPARFIGRGFWNGPGCGPLLFAVDCDGVERLAFREEDGRYPKCYRGGEEQSMWDIVNVGPDVVVIVLGGNAHVAQMKLGMSVEIRDYDVEVFSEDPENGILRDNHGRLYQCSHYSCS